MTPTLSAATDSPRIHQALMKLRAIASGIQQKALRVDWSVLVRDLLSGVSISRRTNNGKSFCLNRLE
jgi:hypothetical protein